MRFTLVAARRRVVDIPRDAAEDAGKNS